MSNTQLSKLKSSIENVTEVTVNLCGQWMWSMNLMMTLIYLREFLLIHRQVSKFPTAFANGSSANIKLSKSHLSRIIQSGGLVDIFLEPLLKAGLPLMSNVLTPLDKSVLISLGLVAASAKNARTYEGTAALIISNEGIEDMKTVTSFKESGLLIKGVIKTIKNEANEQKSGFLSIFLGTLGNLLSGKVFIQAGKGKIKAG